MSRSATRPKPMPAAEAAGLLFDRAVGLLTVSTDQGLAHALAEVLIASQRRLGEEPTDYDAVRAELRRLWGASESVERSRLCQRYAPPFVTTRVQ